MLIGDISLLFLFKLYLFCYIAVSAHLISVSVICPYCFITDPCAVHVLVASFGRSPGHEAFWCHSFYRAAHNKPTFYV
jgi:hypothetical protein